MGRCPVIGRCNLLQTYLHARWVFYVATRQPQTPKPRVTENTGHHGDGDVVVVFVHVYLEGPEGREPRQVVVGQSALGGGAHFLVFWGGVGPTAPRSVPHGELTKMHEGREIHVLTGRLKHCDLESGHRDRQHLGQHFRMPVVLEV